MTQKLLSKKEFKSIYGVPYCIARTARLEAAGRFPQAGTARSLQSRLDRGTRWRLDRGDDRQLRLNISFSMGKAKQGQTRTAETVIFRRVGKKSRGDGRSVRRFSQ